MTEQKSCPICGKQNNREYYTEDVGLVEDYYYCDNCGFNSEMAYSPEYITIHIGKLSDCQWDFELLRKAWNGNKYDKEGNIIEPTKEICDCYHCEDVIAGGKIVRQRNICYGTKEMDECACGGDKTKCDFYKE